VTFLAALALSGLVAVQVDFTGLWYRDDDKSDAAKPAIDEAVKGLIEKTSRGRASAADVDPATLARINEVLDTFIQYADELDLERDRRELVVDDGSERLRIYYLDAEEHARQMPDGTRLETTATASGRGVEVYMKTEHGAEIYETYRLSSDGNTMQLTVRLEDKQLKEDLVIRNVYVRGE